MTIVSPMVKLVPDGGLQTTSGTLPELSEVVGVVHVSKAVGLSSSASMNWLPGHVMLGASISTDR